MWWSRLLRRAPGAPVGPVRFIERVIGPAESHSEKPFRVVRPKPAIETVEPASGRGYRIKRGDGKPNPLKQCF
jgi:hypothetical protein